MATPKETIEWAGETGTVSQLRGEVFKYGCLGAVSFALLSVLVLLLYVAADAFQPFTADPGWHLTFFVTLVVPVVGTSVWYYRRDEPAGEVAIATLGIPIIGLLLAAALAVVLSIELVSVAELFALTVATAVSVGVIVAHARFRPRAAFERLVVLVGAPVVALFGILPEEVTMVVNITLRQLDAPVRLTTRVVSLRELVLSVPYLPLPWLMLVLAVTLPVAAGLGVLVARRRASEDSRTVIGMVVGGALALASLGPFVGPALGIDPVVWILVVTFSVVPLGVYVEGIVRRQDGVPGLAFPVLLVGGILLGAVLVEQFGFAPPDTWLDWQFLTSVHSRTPEDAGFYPPIVGSVMMMIVIALAAFPVGVGAAIYLEEYAPDSGLGGKFVTLVEINIGNLAGVPSVVYGLLGLALFIRILTMPAGSVIVGGLAIGLLILPIVIISAQEALRAVPDSHREASYGMGATRWQTTRNVVLPQAMPGILTGTILAVGRAIGETAPLLMIGAASSVRLAPNGFFDQLPAMPRQIYAWSTNLQPEIRHGVLAAGVVTLVVVLLVMNGTAIIVRNKFQREA
jgi:phosphate transport system permease protein